MCLYGKYMVWWRSEREEMSKSIRSVGFRVTHKYFCETNEDVRSSDDPYIDVYVQRLLVRTNTGRRSVIMTWRFQVKKMLQDRGIEHG